MAPSLLRDLLIADPGLPKNNPTQSYWQNVPHHLAETQSPTLPETVDFAVIGSGITGTSVAKHLLAGSPNASVAILEARTLCSGATGRNGGQCVTFGGTDYADLKKAHGPVEAGKILKFGQDTWDQVVELAQTYALDESEIRLTTRVRAFGHSDSEAFEEVKKSVAEYEEDYPERKGRFRFIDGKEALEVLIYHTFTLVLG
jgi:glycine/D-amino acid oxidase-like deaminating enzyme